MMTTALTTTSGGELIAIMENSLYPGASRASIMLAIEYCKAAGLDPIQKPVHIVPMWSKADGRMRDVIMPGIGLYRTMASRTGQFAGMSEPEFGPDVTENIGGQETTYPAWCRIIVQRRLPTGEIASFAAVERWKENYAEKGGKERSVSPNAMWARRPYGQLAKCAEAQALRKAFPELGAVPTAEEMAGKVLIDESVDAVPIAQKVESHPVMPDDDVQDLLEIIGAQTSDHAVREAGKEALATAREFGDRAAYKRITDHVLFQLDAIKVQA
jgi:phage recombination protein Bet